jgi:hypothetical protein
MRKKQVVAVPNLKDIPFSKALEIAYAGTPLTHAEIAERAGKGRETIRRYFIDPTYNPPVPFLPRLCEIIENNILIEWQGAQRDGHVFFGDCATDEKDIHVKIAELTKEFSDVLVEDAEAMKDGGYDDGELAALYGEINDLVTKGKQAQYYIRKLRAMRKQGKA